MGISFEKTDCVRRYDLLAIYYNKQSPERFLVGKQISMDSQYIAVNLLSPNATYDGYCLCSIADIYRIEVESQYLQNFNLPQIAPYQTDYLKKSLWNSFLTYAEVHNVITQFKDCLGKRIMYGIPLRHGDNAVWVKRICVDGHQGNTYKINRNKITLLVCNSEDELELQKILISEA